MAEINVLHPFREGNGRSKREFTRTFLITKGFELD
ncbi:Fic family protein [Priestia megaterium]